MTARRHRCRNCFALVPVADLRETLPAMLSGRLVPAWQCRARGKCKRAAMARSVAR